jgi:hypothetical protein
LINFDLEMPRNIHLSMISAQSVMCLMEGFRWALGVVFFVFATVEYRRKLILHFGYSSRYSPEHSSPLKTNLSGYPSDRGVCVCVFFLRLLYIVHRKLGGVHLVGVQMEMSHLHGQYRCTYFDTLKI